MTPLWACPPLRRSSCRPNPSRRDGLDGSNALDDGAVWRRVRLARGWLIDRFGRNASMAASIFVYVCSFALCGGFPIPAANVFVFFRSTTFIAVCYESSWRHPWLAELFPDNSRRNGVLGLDPRPCASLGCILVTGSRGWLKPNCGVAAIASGLRDVQITWRRCVHRLLIGCLLPAIRSRSCCRRAGVCACASGWPRQFQRRPLAVPLWRPELRRVTLVAAALSPALRRSAFRSAPANHAPRQLSARLQELSEQQSTRAPLRAEPGS